VCPVIGLRLQRRQLDRTPDGQAVDDAARDRSERVEATPHRRRDRRGQPEFGRQAEDVSVRQHPNQFVRIERIARRRLVDAGQGHRGQRPTGVQQIPQVAAVHRLDRRPIDPARSQRRRQHQRITIERVGSRRRQHHHRFVDQSPEHVAQGLGTQVVQPLQVVDRQDHRGRPRPAPHPRQQVARPTQRVRRRVQHPCGNGIAVPRRLFQQVREPDQCRRAFLVEAARDQDEVAGRDRRRHGLLPQHGLADAGFSGPDHRSRAIGSQHGLLGPRTNLAATDEGDGRRHGGGDVLDPRTSGKDALPHRRRPRPRATAARRCATPPPGGRR